METLGDKIKQLRNALTQEELSAILQVDRSTLASWEVNRREPDIATLCRIAGYFNVSIDWLVGYAPGSAVKIPVDKVQEATRPYRAETAEAWQKVIATAQQYGFTPETVEEILDLNFKLGVLLNNRQGQHTE